MLKKVDVDKCEDLLVELVEFIEELDNHSFNSIRRTLEDFVKDFTELI